MLPLSGYTSVVNEAWKICLAHGALRGKLSKKNAEIHFLCAWRFSKFCMVPKSWHRIELSKSAFPKPGCCTIRSVHDGKEKGNSHCFFWFVETEWWSIVWSLETKIHHWVTVLHLQRKAANREAGGDGGGRLRPGRGADAAGPPSQHTVGVRAGRREVFRRFGGTRVPAASR